MPDERPRATHDMGGASPFLCIPVDPAPHALDAFDRTVDAIRQIVSRRGLMGVDELRRGIEALPEAEYHRRSYYSRWLRSIVATLMAKGVIGEAELREELE